MKWQDAVWLVLAITLAVLGLSLIAAKGDGSRWLIGAITALCLVACVRQFYIFLVDGKKTYATVTLAAVAIAIAASIAVFFGLL